MKKKKATPNAMSVPSRLASTVGKKRTSAFVVSWKLEVECSLFSKPHKITSRTAFKLAMGGIFDYEIPLLHPLVVHFPIALILAGTAAVVAWAVTPKAFWYRVGALALAAGAVASLAAYLTGEAAEDAAEDVPIVDEFVHLHEDLGLYTLGVNVIALVALVLVQPGALFGGEEIARAPSALIRWAVGVLALASAVLVALTSHIGGIMVWGVPVG
jgi:uncharacterized membrane protein